MIPWTKGKQVLPDFSSLSSGKEALGEELTGHDPWHVGTSITSVGRCRRYR